MAAIAAAMTFLSCDTHKDTQHFRKSDNFGCLDEGVRKYYQDLKASNALAELHSVMVLKDGEKIAEYYDCCCDKDFLNICFSASKTFTAAAVGFAADDGLLDIHDKVISFFSEDELPEVISDTLKELDIYNLLRMSSGLVADPVGPIWSGVLENPVREGLQGGFSFYPGEKFSYNSFNTFLLSAIVTKVTGKPAHKYLEEKLFTPLGIRNYVWDTTLEGYSMGGWGLYLTTEGLAKMGQFLLNKGEWKGKRLLSEKWVEAMTSPHIAPLGNYDSNPDLYSGYGYQTWMCSRKGSFRLDGAYGQWVIICPDKNAVIVITQHITIPNNMFPSLWKDIYDYI